MFIFIFIDGKCSLYVYQEKSHFLIRQSTLCHFLPLKMWYLFIYPCVALAHNIYLSSSLTNLAIFICLLVFLFFFFFFFIFGVYLNLVKAVTLILKQATLLRTSLLPKPALANAELNYRKANIDVTIQQHLRGCAAQQSVEQFVGFIMSTDLSTDIGLFIFFHLSHQYLIILLVSSQSSAHANT